MDVTNNVSDRVEFLNVIYDHVFFDRSVWEAKAWLAKGRGCHSGHLIVTEVNATP